MLVVGIDENGLGPQLGPLVVTASLMDAEDPSALSTDILRESKQVFTSGKRMGEGEETVLSFYKSLKGHIPSSSSEILGDLLLPLPDTCTSPLPHCLPTFELPHWVTPDYIDERIAHYYLKKVGAHLLEIKSIALCPAQLNRRLESYSKNHIDFLLFEELMIHFKEKLEGKEVLFLCGGIGSTRNYEPFFVQLASLNCKAKRETEEVCYSFPGLGEVRFIKNGDEKYFPIALSSLFGKYIRELFVEQMNNFFHSHLPHLPYCSGYRDRVTERFIKETENLRKRLNLPRECFIREK